MKQYLAYLDSVELNSLQNKLSSERGLGRAIRTYLIREYELPENKDGIKHMLLQSDNKHRSTTLWLSKAAEKKLSGLKKDLLKHKEKYEHLFVKQGPQDNYGSVIIRNVIFKMNRSIEAGTYSYDLESKIYRLPKKIVSRINEIYETGSMTKVELSESLETFILQRYKGPTCSVKELKSRSSEGTERINITLVSAAFEKIRSITNEYHEDHKIKESAVIRDSIRAFLEDLAPE